MRKYVSAEKLYRVLLSLDNSVSKIEKIENKKISILMDELKRRMVQVVLEERRILKSVGSNGT